MSQRYRSPVPGGQGQRVTTPQQRENSPYTRTTPNPRQENSPFSQRHNTDRYSQQDAMSDVESSRRRRTPESLRKYNSPPTNPSLSQPSMYSVTPPSTAEVLRTDNAHIHEQNRSYVGQQQNSSIPLSTPEHGRRMVYNNSSTDNVNSSITSSNMSSIPYNSSPYKQTTPSSVQTDAMSQPSSVFMGNSPKSYNAHVSARLYSPQQMANFSRNSAQENLSYNSSMYASDRSHQAQNNSMYNKNQSPGVGPQSNEPHNHRQSQSRGPQERSPHYDKRGPQIRQQQEISPYSNRSQSGVDQTQLQVRSPSKANHNYSSHNGHAGLPPRTNYTSPPDNSFNTSQVRDEYVWIVLLIYIFNSNL